MDLTEPVAGIPPLVWLFIVLILGPAGLLSNKAAERFGMVGAISRWWTERTRRSIQREHSVAVERQKSSDLVYSALEGDLLRLVKQVNNQGARHTQEIEQMRAEMREQKEWYESVLEEMRETTALWQLWGQWVTEWAAQASHPTREFLPFHEFVPKHREGKS